MFSKNQRIRYILLLSMILIPFANIHGKVVQILHTNDLHGLIENTIIDEKLGGYAAIKSLIDQQKAAAKDQGIHTLVFDGGDFLEGHISYFAQNGKRNMEIMNLMGYDAVVLGNHDWLMGTGGLNKLLDETPPKFSLLGSNFTMNPFFTAIHKNIKPYKIINVDGIKIAIIGITTKEIFYSWVVKKFGKILSLKKSFKRYAKHLKESGEADYVIALTHIGHLADQKLAKGSRYIDLVVGGHSHLELHKPMYVKNKKGHDIAIVQTGAHGKFIGKILIDVAPEKPLKVLKYELLPVHNKIKDPVIASHVKHTKEILQEEYGKEWLEEVIGRAEIPLNNSLIKSTVWSHVIADAIRESVDAQVSIHAPDLTGASLPAGPITREDLFNTYPRVFDFDNRQGWKIYKVKVWGFILKMMTKFITKNEQNFSISGMTFDVKRRKKIKNRQKPEATEEEVLEALSDALDNQDLQTKADLKKLDKLVDRFSFKRSKYKIKNLKINGKKVRPFKSYTVALPAGVVIAGLGITKIVGKILRSIKKKDITVWQALVNKVRAVGTITKDYCRKGCTSYMYTKILSH